MAGDEQVRIDGRLLRLTNLDKVLYPETGTTKAEVIDYYTRIAPLILPQLAGRPVTRKRWPNSVDQPSFFTKDLERGAPDWIPRMPIEHSTGTKYYPLVNDVPTLVYLAQMAALELHVPQWRFAPGGARGNPDRLVLDLDPGEGVELSQVAEVARWCRSILSDMGLDPVPVTSGSKGIHLYAALPGQQTSDEVSAVARELARAIEADHPDLVVSAMARALRPGKVFIDWSQNSASKTTVAPYSMRGRPHPWVAAPRTWEELEDPGIRQLLFTEVLTRLDSTGSPSLSRGRVASTSSATGPLTAYIAKRDAGRTPEPVPEVPHAPVGSQQRFVIQEHHASRLHWDLRLERDGVLVSWAVPRGIPPTPDRNNLAIMTEDHPLEYLTFHGTIPRGEYGAGDMTIWDTGEYELEKWRDDEVIFTLHGQPDGPLGTVRLALIRTSGSGEKSQWLLHRMKGASGPGGTSSLAGTSSPAGEKPFLPRETTSHVVSHAESGFSPGTAAAGAVRPMLATSSTPGLARDAAVRWGGGGAWAEVKWDGIRAIGVWDGSRLRLYARSGTDITARYPELTGVDPGLGPDAAIVDGEIIALDAHGRPSFTRLQNRMHLTKPREITQEASRTPVRYHLFDVLSHADDDVAGLPLVERRDILEAVADGTIDEIDVPPVFDDVDDALAMSRRFGLEGIVVKNPASRYRRGARSEDWLKVKLTHAQEVVIGGIRPGKGGRTGTIGSLLVGIPGPDGLRYAGRVGTGFSDVTLHRLDAVLQPLRTDADPFVGVPAADASDALWVRPELVAEVEYGELTPAGILRHSRWRGLRPDKSPDEVTREA